MQLLVRFQQHDRARTYLRWLLLAFFAMPHTKTYKKYQLGRSSIYDLSNNICPTTRRNIPWLRFVSRRQPQPPALPRRILGARGETPLHFAAVKGHAAVVEQLISAGATVDAADGIGRGPGRVFRVVLRVALTRWRKGFVHWQLIFVLCFGMLSGTRTCCLRIHFCDGMGLLKFGCKKWPNMEGKGMSGTESRRM